MDSPGPKCGTREARFSCWIGIPKTESGTLGKSILRAESEIGYKVTQGLSARLIALNGVYHG